MHLQALAVAVGVAVYVVDIVLRMKRMGFPAVFDSLHRPAFEHHDRDVDAAFARRFEPVLQLDDVATIMSTAREVMIARPLLQAVVHLVSSTQPAADDSSPLAREYFRYGASPRALQSIVRSARIKALMAGRAHVAGVDLAAVALPALRHRVLLTMESEVRGVDIDQLLAEHIESWAQRL
jgi:MoxR-like ATPase